MAIKLETVITIFVMLFLILVLPPQAKGEWWLTVSDDEILLIRSDADPDNPKHEIDSGTYGYWEYFEGEYYWNDVMYINSPPVVHEPFDPADLRWIPGPLDVDDGDYDDDGEGPGDIGDDDQWRARWNHFIGRYGDELPDGWESWSAQEWWTWYEESRGLYINGRRDNGHLRNLWRHFPQWWDRHGGGQ